MLNWYKGMEVACVDNEGAADLRLHTTYVIREIIALRCGTICIEVGVRLIASRQHCTCCGEFFNAFGTYAYYRAARFRPLDELLNEEIQELLQPQTVEV